jgi:hypothetical protein
VQVVERWILMRLRHQRFASVAEVNPRAVVDTLSGLGHMGLLGDPASVRASLQRHWERVSA